MRNIITKKMGFVMAAAVSVQAYAGVTFKTLSWDKDSKNQSNFHGILPNGFKIEEGVSFKDHPEYYPCPRVIYVDRTRNAAKKLGNLAENNAFLTHWFDFIDHGPGARERRYDLPLDASGSVSDWECNGLPISKLPLFSRMYKVNFSSDPSVVKRLIMRVVYELHRSYEEDKATLFKEEGLETCLEDFFNSKIERCSSLIEQYGEHFTQLSQSVAVAQVDKKRFIFQLPDTTVLVFSRMQEKRNYILATLDEEGAERQVPEAWYDQELNMHLVLEGLPPVGPKSTNISHGTPSSSSTGRNNNTKEEMEAEMKEEKHKG